MAKRLVTCPQLPSCGSGVACSGWLVRHLTCTEQRCQAVTHELGLEDEVTFHSLRGSYMTHLIEDGFMSRHRDDRQRPRLR